LALAFNRITLVCNEHLRDDDERVKVPIGFGQEDQLTGHGTFYWMELNTGDVERAKSFFADTIGWTFRNEPVAQGEYWLALSGDIPVAGIVALNAFAPPGAPPHWFSYLAVDDVDARCAAATRSGATLIRAPFDIPDVGRVAIIRDPTGAAMGWMTPVARPS
jgi:predicted enzyme related to lactoylglutathione lyase